MPDFVVVAVPIAVSVIGLLYLVLFGQRSVGEALRERRGRAGQRPARGGRTPVVENLPSPDHGTFLGRDAEVARVVELLRPYPQSQHAVVAIDGLGGAGKSALALAVARRYVERHPGLRPSEWFGAVIWASAKEDVLTADGPVARPWPQRVVKDIFETIAICLGREDITRAPLHEWLPRVNEALKRQRTLLIIDNLETIDDEGVYAFLRELPAPTKALVTTRRKIDVAVSVTLSGLAHDDSVALLRERCDDAQLSEGFTERLVDAADGVPLAIVWAAGQLRLGVPPESVLDGLAQGTDALTEFSFGSIWQRLVAAGRPGHLGLLAALALLPEGTTVDVAAAAAAVPDRRQAGSALGSLARFSLVRRTGERWELHPLVRGYTVHRVAADAPTYLRPAADHLAKLLGGIVGDERLQSITAREYEAVDPHRVNVLYLVDWCFEQADHPRVVRLVRSLGYYLHARGFWLDAVRAWERGAAAAEACGETEAQARFVTYLGYMAYFLGDLDRARFYQAEAVRLVPADVPSYQLGSLLRLNGYLAAAGGEPDRAIELFTDGLAAMVACDSPHGMCRLLNDMAESLIAAGRFAEAEGAARRALSIADRAGESIERVRSICVLAAHARAVGQLEQARVYATESRAEALGCGWWEDAGKASLELARVEVAARRFAEARHQLDEAHRYFERINSSAGIAACAVVRATVPAAVRRGPVRQRDRSGTPR